MNPSPVVSFQELHAELHRQYLELSSSQREFIDHLVMEVGIGYLNALSVEDFERINRVYDEDRLLTALRPSVSAWMQQTHPEDFPVPRDLAELAVSVMLVHWLTPSSVVLSRWRTQYSNAIKAAIEARTQALEAARQPDGFYDQLGTPSEPPTTSPKPWDPTAESLQDAGLEPEVKVNVLRNALDALNQRGITTADGVYRTNCLKYPPHSLEAARRFFMANPSVTANDLLLLMGNSLEALQSPEPPAREEDPHYHLRRCHSLSYLLQMLRQVVKEQDPEFEVDRYLTKKELFGKHFEVDGGW